MAQTSEDFLNRITGLTQQLGESPLPTGQDIMSELSARVGDFAPQFQELRGAEAAATAAPASVLGDLAQRFGGGAGGGPSAFRSLQSAVEERGRQFGTANVLRDILTQQQGTLGGIGQNVLGQAESGRQNIMDQINTLMPLFQTLAGQEESARGRSAGQLDIQALIDGILGGGQDQTNEFGGTGQLTEPEGGFFSPEGVSNVKGLKLDTNREFNRARALTNPDILQRLSPASRQVPGQITGAGGGGGMDILALLQQGLQGFGGGNQLGNLGGNIGQSMTGINNLFR